MVAESGGAAGVVIGAIFPLPMSHHGFLTCGILLLAGVPDGCAAAGKTYAPSEDRYHGAGAFLVGRFLGTLGTVSWIRRGISCQIRQVFITIAPGEQ
jgi:hypothetical protein